MQCGGLRSAVDRTNVEVTPKLIQFGDIVSFGSHDPSLRRLALGNECIAYPDGFFSARRSVRCSRVLYIGLLPSSSAVTVALPTVKIIGRISE